VQQESSEQIGAVVPSQRGEQSTPPPGPSAMDETLVLPAFVTGKRSEPKPAEPVRHQAPDTTLPPSERGMLIFVAALLGLGTLAMVTVLGVGGFARPAHHTGTPTKAAAAPVAATTPSASPTGSPSPSPVVASAPAQPVVTTMPATPRRSSSPAKVTLGTLTRADPSAFCMDSMAGRARPHSDGSWSCTGTQVRPAFTFTPTDVCQWRYVDKTAYATVGDQTDPATWTCYT
jgi:hypothetical protein